MEYKGVANYHGDWEIKEQFLSSDLHRVMDLDATVNSHPIVQVGTLFIQLSAFISIQ